MDARPGIGIMVGPHGRGSNMSAIVRACKIGEIPADVKVVVASGPESGALEVALSLGVASDVVLPGEDYGPRLIAAFDGCDWLCLAGYLRILPVEVLEHYPGRVLNIHPSLLPKFGGKGMYGKRVHEAVIAAGESESGCTVHIVNEKYDDGPIILQISCPVLPDDTADSLAARVLELEHRAFPLALSKVICDRSR